MAPRDRCMECGPTAAKVFGFIIIIALLASIYGGSMGSTNIVSPVTLRPTFATTAPTKTPTTIAPTGKPTTKKPTSAPTKNPTKKPTTP